MHEMPVDGDRVGLGQVVADSSVVVALLIDAGTDGQWAVAQSTGMQLLAPELLPFEAAFVLRRHERAGVISPHRAEQAHRTMIDMDIRYVPYDVLADSIWVMRQQVSTYDAGYCALADALGAPLLTLDRRLARAVGRQLDVRTPPS